MGGLSDRPAEPTFKGAGAAGTAGVVKLRDRLAGRRVGTILSGGNLNRGVLERALSDTDAW